MSAAEAAVPVERSAWLSADGVYRYELRRTWDPTQEHVGWIMLNPSTADAHVDDPTIRRCIGFAKGWGYGGIVVRNIFALRATNPRALLGHPDPIGPDNQACLVDGITHAGITVCAWGAWGALHDRGEQIRQAFTESGAVLYHLGLTKNGAPRHPLYLPGAATPIAWRGEQ
jgi:hypothetical protein